jgi:hypothetical protein
MGIVFLTTGTALFAASVLTGSDWLMAIANVVIGAEIERSGPPAGVISITLGLLLLLVSWNRRRRGKREGAAAAGAKSRALRDALSRRVRRLAFPVPA